jgi:competence ComEA-like helix-hairpin-helix protein
VQVEAVVQLLDEGNTVPFITRYRKERTGGLDEEMIRRIQLRVNAARALAERKQTILKSIAAQGRLTDPLVDAIFAADHIKRLEDLYLPFKPKKRTLASDAREKGLEPAAMAVWYRDEAVADLPTVLNGLVNPDKKLNTVEDVTTGVRHILAEVVSENADVRGALRMFLRDTAILVTSKADGVPEGKGLEFRDYFDFKEPVRMMPPHRILAMNRGEHEKVLRVKMECDAQQAKHITFDCLPLFDHPHREFIIPAMEDAVDRLLLPSLEREIRREMTEFAQDHGVDIFARNLRSLLLRAPLGGKRVLAIDPGLRSGCKVAVLDETGNLLDESVIYPHPPQKDMAGAKRKLEQLIRKHQTGVIAIGNGTGCRETETIVSELIADFVDRKVNPRPVSSPIPQVTTETPTVTAAVPAAIEPPPLPSEAASTTVAAPVLGTAETVVATVGLPASGTSTDTAVIPTALPAASDPPPLPTAAPIETITLDGLPDPPADVAYVIVNEAGASDYSASPIAKDEFPNLDATARGTISIGRRLQDPLAELVKVDPQHVGVGLYQHDMRPKYLKESLEGVIESCVNAVGVDVNTASVPLLRHVSGLNQLVARELVEYRRKHGPFQTREQLKSVPQMGEARFTQAAGFLKIRDGSDPLDNTWIHPESYHIARQVLEAIGHTPADLKDPAQLADIREKLRTQNPEAIANIHKVGGATVRDIFDAIARPGRDIRDERHPPIFRKGILNLEDLTQGMELKGEILNVVDFGAFVDVGLKDSGLIHISQMANRFIKSPYDVVNVGDVVSVWVKSVDPERRRVSLSMIPPGQERTFERRSDRPPMERPPHERSPRTERVERSERQDRPPVQKGPPPGPQRPIGERAGFVPRPASTIPPPTKPGQGRPAGLYRGPQPPSGPRAGAPPQLGPSTSESGPVTPPQKPKVNRPVPTLSEQQKTGKADLNTFAQLAAMFGGESVQPEPPKPEKKKKQKSSQQPPTPSEQPPASEQPIPATDTPPSPPTS